MDSIFYGLILAFIDLNINGLDIIPDWVGYLLMYRGLGQLAAGSGHFTAARPWCLGLAAVNLLLVFTRFNGPNGVLLSSAIGLLFSAAFLYTLYLVLQGLGDLQTLYPESDLELPLLNRRWKNTCVITAAMYVFPLFARNGLATAILSLAGLVVYILFLMALHRSRQAYYGALRTKSAEPAGYTAYTEIPAEPTENDSATE